MERETSMLDNNHRNVVHQTDFNTLKKHKDIKVKLITFEEVALLGSPQRCKSNAHPASPPKVKKLFSMKCKSPIRSGTQIPVLKQCAAASQNPAKIENNTKLKAQSVILPGGTSTSREDKERIRPQIQDEPREKKFVSADEGRINPQTQDGTRKKSDFNDSGSDTGVVVISSSVEHARRPVPPSCWTGCFAILDGKSCYHGEFQAYFPSKVSSKVFDIVKKMPNNIKLEMLPRHNDWPKLFQTRCPAYDDISLFFFNGLDCHEKKHPSLLETNNNFVMRAHIGNIKLLIYSSEVLPPDSQWIDGENYLWGVFLKGKSNPARHAHP